MENWRIEIKDIDHSVKVQECLFKLGCDWKNNGKDVIRRGEAWFYIENKVITWGFIEIEENLEFKLITLEELQIMADGKIEFENINSCDNLSFYKLEIYNHITLKGQIEKIKEEFQEVVEAFEKGDRVNLLEELADVMQAVYGAIKVIANQEKELGRKGNLLKHLWKKHKRKLKDRGAR